MLSIEQMEQELSALHLDAERAQNMAKVCISLSLIYINLYMYIRIYVYLLFVLFVLFVC